MWKMATLRVCVLLSLIPNILKSSTGLKVSPQRATRSIGDTVRLNCSDPKLDTLHWIHVPLGSRTQTYIYNSGIGIQMEYKLGGRHSVEVDDSSGSCDLLIKRLSVEDAGTYICRRDDGEYLEMELIILVSKPTCESNSSLTDVLVENDCGLETDSIKLKCSAGYHGNIPPHLESRHSSDPDIIVSNEISHQSTASHKIVKINSLARVSNIQMNGTQFICSVDEKESEEKSYGCATRNISVMYLFNSTENRSVEILHDDQPVNISCLANTSQQCHYRWRVTSQSTKNPIEIIGQTIDLLKHDYREMRCLAECLVRDKYCTVEPLYVELFKSENGSWKSHEISILSALPGFVFVTGILLFIWFKRISRRKEAHIDGSQGELQPLYEHPETKDQDVVQKQMQKMVNCLNSEQLICSLISMGVLSDEERNTLIQQPQCKETCLNILTHTINTRSRLNSLVAKMVESDPNFQPSVSAVIELIRQNNSTLVECLDVDHGLAEFLFSKGISTFDQYEKLNNKSSWSSFQKKYQALLSNMLPSRLISTNKCKIFLTALIETDQTHVFNFVNKLIGNIQVNVGDQRIMTVDEINIIDRNLYHLIKLIEPNQTFLNSLSTEGCITQRHKNWIETQHTVSDKNKELLNIIRRRSFKDFKTFKGVIQSIQKNKIISKLLEQESGHVVSVHCKITIEPETMMTPEDLTMLETEIADHLMDPSILNQSLTQGVIDELNEMHDGGIYMIGAIPTESVIVYFTCPTFQSIVAFKQMVVKDISNKC